MRTVYTIHADSGHGWLRVTIGEVTQLGFNVSDFSRYSYRKGNDLFLEEDCDMAKFMIAYSRRFGQMPTLEDDYIDGDSPIRRYARIA